MLLVIGSFLLSNGSSEDVGVLLFWEVDVIVSVRVRELSRVISIILEERVRSELSTVLPSL